MKSLILSVMVGLSLTATSSFAATGTTPASKPKSSQQLININQAEVKDLYHVYKGIGLRRAKAIVAYRSKNGSFLTVAELAKVKQVGKAYVEHNLAGLEKVLTAGK